ncbi:MAG TPA: DMT family transporter [Acetobacteraceae bacterium]|nr:DMT family transporter [Acetobacteraceae bacterium]
MSPPPDPASSRRRGVLLVLGAAGGFCVAAAFAKALGTAVPVAEVIFFRNLFAVLALLPLMLATHGTEALRTRHPGQHALRTIFGLMGMVGAFYGYVHLPLATVTALGFTMPLFLTVLSYLLLGERVRWRRGLAVLVGFCGVLLMIRPGAEAMRADGLAIALVLMGALGWALAMITIRRMGDAGESGPTIVLWFAIASTLVSGVAAIPGWVWPASAWHWVLLAGIGLVSAGAQIAMTEAYRRGETTLLAPFEYSAIVWTTALGMLVWSEYPDAFDIAGILVLVGAGLYIWHREVQLGIRR